MPLDSPITVVINGKVHTMAFAHSLAAPESSTVIGANQWMPCLQEVERPVLKNLQLDGLVGPVATVTWLAKKLEVVSFLL